MNKGDRFRLFDFRSHPRFQQAFSLVELLIVISIFTVLLSLLFPGLKKTVYLAKNAECMTRLKNINLVLNLYAHDFNDYHLDHEGRAKGSMLARREGTNTFDFRPLLRTYLSDSLNPSMICPLALPYWETSESEKVYSDPNKNLFNLDDVNPGNFGMWTGIPQTPYMIYPGNHSTMWFEGPQVQSRINPVGEAFQLRPSQTGANDYFFDVLISDTLFKYGNTTYATTHAPLSGEGEILNYKNLPQWPGSLGFGHRAGTNRGMPGWFLQPFIETTANFSTSDGAVHHYEKFSFLGASETGFCTTMHSSRGFALPLELGWK